MIFADRFRAASLTLLPLLAGLLMGGCSSPAETGVPGSPSTMASSGSSVGGEASGGATTAQPAPVSGSADPGSVPDSFAHVGDCFNYTGLHVDVDLVSCDAPHDDEIVGVIPVETETWSEAVWMSGDIGSKNCPPAAQEYLGSKWASSAAANVATMLATETEWDQGHHYMYCVVSVGYGGDKRPTTGSLRGTFN